MVDGADDLIGRIRQCDAWLVNRTWWRCGAHGGGVSRSVRRMSVKTLGFVRLQVQVAEAPGRCPVSGRRPPGVGMRFSVRLAFPSPSAMGRPAVEDG